MDNHTFLWIYSDFYALFQVSIVKVFYKYQQFNKPLKSCQFENKPLYLFIEL